MLDNNTALFLHGVSYCSNQLMFIVGDVNLKIIVG